MTQPSPRRRILCLRPGPNPSAGPILTATSDEWVETLALHADVFPVETDFDLAETCARLKPDLIILDAVNWTRPWPLAIGQARACPDIPRLLFLNSDPHDPMRALTMRAADELGVEAVFVTGEAYRQHMPELAHLPSFFAPQFVNGTLYRDYHLPKIIPVSVFGGYLSPDFYAWRAQLLGEIQRVFPTFIYTHPGYDKSTVRPFTVRDEAYARLLSQSHFSAADTTRLDYGVRKHLEIPGSGAVLIAPQSDALASYGFIDMTNCILGSGQDLFEKMDLVARAPAEYQRIRDAGMALVHDRYTRRTWRHMIDWLECRLHLKPGQVVQQIGRYGPFRGVSPNASTPSVMAASQADSDIAAALRFVRSAILSGDDLTTALARIEEVRSWIGHIAEPYFMLGLLALLQGDPMSAAVAIGRRAQAQGSIDVSLGTLDPVETAWLLLIARLIDNPELDAAMREQASLSRHVSLRRMVWLLDRRGSNDEPGPEVIDRQPGDLVSVHWLGDEDFTLWCDLVRRILMANLSCPGATMIATRFLAEAA